MKKLLLTLILIGNLVFAQNDTIAIKKVEFNSGFTYKMLDQNQDLRKINILLEEKKNGTINNNSLIIGTSLISIFDYQHSNTDSKFAYLMRHPTSNNQIGKEVSEAVIHSFQLSITATVNSWISTHAEILYNPEQSFGSGTITDLNRNQLQLRKAFVLIGNLDMFPIYGALGKMDAPFGQMGSVSPFTNTTMWHAFGGLGYGAQIGFAKGGLHAKLMAVQGGAQFRALHTPVGDGTNVPSKINNYVADINYSFNILEDVKLLVGASYLKGSAYCQDFPVTHFSSCKENNPAYTYYGTLSINNRLIVKGGFAKTTKVWKGTYNPAPPLNIFEASKVSSLDVGAKYDLNENGKFKHTISGEFSNFRAGADGAPWERQNQMVLGFATLINNSSKLFAEVFRTDGYAPLNFISGSDDNAPFPAGTTHSLREANSMGIVVGAQISF
ncbi:hypothetical protein [Lacinutrix sp. Bg11-31]|uniref:hypothetical protein n=1 Tax=Lacinutrix sp. Bg11-31 TaxID=2057808 RepID=UPI000C315A7E|nr:hypothetical protein [Lacinutrix sp. Bg11-31]AUC80678.1 hypothetical protein CW733_00405 [Lacinutrix sp. Bg11-31]